MPPGNEEGRPTGRPRDCLAGPVDQVPAFVVSEVATEGRRAEREGERDEGAPGAVLDVVEGRLGRRPGLRARDGIAGEIRDVGEVAADEAQKVVQPGRGGDDQTDQ